MFQFFCDTSLLDESIPDVNELRLYRPRAQNRVDVSVAFLLIFSSSYISVYVSLTQTCPPQTISRVYTTSARAISVHHLPSFRSEGPGCRRACASKKRSRRSGRPWGKPSLALMSCLFSGDETNNGCKQACLALTESAKPCGYPVAFLLISSISRHFLDTST